MDGLPEEIDDIPVVLLQVFLQQDEDQVLVLCIGPSGILAGIERDPGAPDHRVGSFDKPDILIRELSIGSLFSLCTIDTRGIVP